MPPIAKRDKKYLFEGILLRGITNDKQKKREFSVGEKINDKMI